MKLTRVFLASLFLCFSLFAAAQSAVLNGIVRDASGQPLEGATVALQGTNTAVVTNSQGAYSISAKPGKYTLVISFVGYTTQRLQVDLPAGGASQDVGLTSAGDLGAVTVVGSRSAGRTRTETAVPVDVIPLAQVMNEVGQVDLNQLINFVAPSFQSARQTISDGTDHVDPGQLRGLGPDQVLILINGKRRHQSSLVNVNGTVNRGTVGTDMSAIPANAIERVEILRDGAAAQYGSDAIAGVINIVLKKRTGLLEANVNYGMNITRYDRNFALFKQQGKTDDPSVTARDGETLQAALSYGLNIGKGHLNLTGEYTNRSLTNRSGTYTGAVYPNVNGVNRDDSIMAARGLNRESFDMLIGQSEMKAAGVFYNLGLPIGNRSEFYAFGGYNKKDGRSAGFYRYPSGIPGAARGFANQVFAIYPNGFLPFINSGIVDFSTAVGFRSKLGEWNFDISNTYGRNTFDFTIDNSANYSQFSQAGNRQTSFDAGGVRFWQNTVNADLSRKVDVLQGLNIAAGSEYRIDAYGIDNGEEASYRNYDVASGAAAGAQVFAGFNVPDQSTQTRNAFALYSDNELDVTKNWLVTGALRFENYSDFGNTLNYKFSTRYKFGDRFNLRASHSTGFRAPSMQQRFYTKTNTLFVSINSQLVPVESGTFPNGSRAAQLLGIPELQEETSKSYSVGFTAKPFRGLELTVDAYQIDIDNRIVLTNNFTGGTNAQLQAQLNAAGASTANFFTNAIDTRNRGLESVATYTKTIRKHAIRLTLASTLIKNEVKKDGNGIPVIKTSPVLVASGQAGNYFNREDQSRIEVANPRNKFMAMFNYKYAKFSTLIRVVRFGSVTYLDPGMNPANPSAFPINLFTGQRETLDQTFSPTTITDLSLSYEVKPWLTATVGANNLFDVYQDRHSHSGNMSLGRFVYSRRVQQSGFNGAYYFGRLKLSLPTGNK